MSNRPRKKKKDKAAHLRRYRCPSCAGTTREARGKFYVLHRLGCPLRVAHGLAVLDDPDGLIDFDEEDR